MHRSHEIDVLARTLWGEARGEGRAGMEAVAAVVANRVKDRRWPDTFAGVCKQPWQFSAWNENDPNRAKMQAVTEANAAFALAVEIATRTVDGRLADVTGGANHYFTAAIDPPRWAGSMTEVAPHGAHRFFIG